MRQIVFTISSLLLLLTLGGVFIVGTIDFSHSRTEVAHHDPNCPFMNHGESICPMSVLDHLSVLRNIFESVLPNLVIILLIASTISIFYSLKRKSRPSTKSRSYVHLKWRTLILTSFIYKPHQELFSSGILNPKLF